MPYAVKKAVEALKEQEAQFLEVRDAQGVQRTAEMPPEWKAQLRNNLCGSYSPSSPTTRPGKLLLIDIN